MVVALVVAMLVFVRVILQMVSAWIELCVQNIAVTVSPIKIWIELLLVESINH